MAEYAPPPDNIDDWILYEDQWLLIINKPSGLRTIPDGYNTSLPNLASILRSKYGKVWVIHRLDKETSGIIVFALNPQVHRTISLQFMDREIQKEYRAIISGNPGWDSYSCDEPLKVNGDRHHRTIVHPASGKPATTEFLVLDRFDSYCYIAVKPHTGYTHQIRAHLSWLGFPIVNDPLYHPHKSNQHREEYQFPSSQLCLHAFVLTFTHPELKQTVTYQASLPAGFHSNLSSLKNK